MFVPHRGGDVRELQVSLPVLATALALVAVFVFSSVALVAGLFKSTFDANRLDVLSRENRELAARLSVMSEALTTVHRQMGELVDREREIRVLADLPDLDPAERALGVGGRTAVSVPDGASPVRKTALVMEADLDRIVREAEFERRAFEQIHAAILARRDVLDHTPSILPTFGSFTRGFGLKRDPFTGFYHLHSGLDIAAPHGTPVYATADGQVRSAEWSPTGYGNVIQISHGYGFETRYAHLTSMFVGPGDRVARGQVIATVGSTGKSTGPHLHYEVRVQGDPVNPKTYILSTIINREIAQPGIEEIEADIALGYEDQGVVILEGESPPDTTAAP